MMPLSLLDEIRKPDSGAMVNCAFGLPMARLAQCNLTGTRKHKKKYLKYYSLFWLQLGYLIVTVTLWNLVLARSFLTAILHRGLRNDFFFSGHIYFFHILFGLLFPFSIWIYISLFCLDFYFPFLFGLLFPFSIWTLIRFKFVLNSFSHKPRSDLGFLPSFF